VLSRGEARTWDTIISEKCGPILKQTYEIITGKQKSTKWCNNISQIDNDKIQILKTYNEKELSQLSQYDKNKMIAIFNKYDWNLTWNQTNIIKTFPEWEKTKGNNEIIELIEILNTKNCSKELLNYFTEHLENDRDISEKQLIKKLKQGKKEQTYVKHSTSHDLPKRARIS